MKKFEFLSTPSARRATELTLPVAVDVEISIHALREEGDLDIDTYEGLTWEISIHALREEGDLLTGVHTERHRKFLSTPSARRAT